MTATIALEVQDPSRLRLTQELEDDVLERHVRLRVVFLPFGLGGYDHQSVERIIDYSLPDGCTAVAFCQEVYSDDPEVETVRNYVSYTPATGEISTIDAEQFAEFTEGVYYDHSAIDHGPDGPVDNGDENVEPNPEPEEPEVPEEPAPEPEPEPDPPFDPGDYTIADVQQYVEGLPGAPDEPDVIAEVQRLLDLERNGQARVTLINWLDARLGAV